MANVGYASLSIIPSMRGFSQELTRQLVEPAREAGGEAGTQASGTLLDKMKVGAAAAGAVAGALLVKGLTDAVAQANVTSKLQAQLGASGKDAARFGKLAGKLYTSGVTESFEGAADVIKNVMQSGIAPAGATNKQLQSIATKASDVASVFSQDLGGVTNAVSQMMRTGLAKSSAQAFDLITVGLQSGADKAGDFLDTINEYGTQFRKAGLDGASAIGLLNQAIRAGARDSDIAADAIKEFSIRAVDGSESTADGFKALGLNADDMAAKFAKGGKSANGVLDLTLDKLRGVKDPVKQSQIAVGLFGTQAEDLGKALFAMDPSKAADGLGKVGGAADKAGKTIRSGPSHAIEVFTRNLKQGFVTFLGGTLLPLLGDVAHWLSVNLGPAIRGIADAVSGVIGWFREWGAWLAPLALLIGGVTLALNAQAIATGLVIGVMSVYSFLSKGITLVTQGWAAAQGVLNAVMALNPIALVVIALVALGAALFVAWKKSETFRSIVMATWRGIQGAVGVAWRSVIKPTLGSLMTGLRAVGGVFSWLWNNGVKPAFSGIKSTVSTVWSSGIKPVFDTMKSATGKVADAFEAARKAIKLAWDKVKSIAKAPVAFVINTVYNGGIVRVWNKVADVFGAPTLDPIKGFATGGVLPGYTPGRDVHLAALSGGEAVMRPEWTRAVGPGYVHSMNSAARSGGVAGVQRALGLPAFADGGIFGWVKSAASKGIDFAKSGVDWLKDGIKASALAGMNGIVKPLIDKIAGSASLYRDMITGIPKKMLSAIFDFSGKADKKLSAAGIGGKGFKSALSFARSQAGKPYIWGGVGPAGYDCSGFMSAIENIIRGLKPYSRRWATGAFSGATAPSGWVRGARSPFRVGITNAGVGHTAGTLNGVNVESRGGDGVVVGAGARGYNDRLFTDWYGLKGYSKGTRGATPGWAWVGELGPELVRFGGGEEVLNHRDSRKVASTMGALPGYAKGTSSAKARAAARKQVPGDLTAVTKALTGSAADIKKAFDELTKDLKAAGGAGKGLASSTTKASAKLQALAKQRDSVDARLEAARTAAADQKKAAQDYIGLGALTSASSISDLIIQMQARQSSAAGFQKQIAGLSKKGLSQDLISQLVAMGPGGAFIDLIAGASKGQISQLNALSKSGSALSTSYGRTMADAMFDAGKNASKGFLTGLVSQEKELQAAMNKLAAGLVSSIKKKLKINSPSRVTQWLGEMTGAGVGVGLDHSAAQVAASAARVANAAVPAIPSATISSAAARGALAPGQPVVLRIQDGPLLRGWVEGIADTRVDTALDEALATAGAGYKGE